MSNTKAKEWQEEYTYVVAMDRYVNKKTGLFATRNDLFVEYMTRKNQSNQLNNIESPKKARDDQARCLFPIKEDTVTR
jgi:hypothetical protein